MISASIARQGEDSISRLEQLFPGAIGAIIASIVVGVLALLVGRPLASVLRDFFRYRKSVWRGRISALSKSIEKEVGVERLPLMVDVRVKDLLDSSGGDSSNEWDLLLPLGWRSTRDTGTGGTDVGSFLMSAVSSGESVLILGDPGGGKTTTLYGALWRLRRRAEASRSAAVPLYLNAHGTDTVSLIDRAVDRVCERLEAPPKGRAIIEQLIKDGQIAFLLDGLDEADIANADSPAQAAIQGRVQGVTAIVACRKRYYEDFLARTPLALSFDHIVELVGVSEQRELARYLRALQSANVSSYPAALRQLEAVELDWDSMRENPLTATMLLQLLHSHGGAVPRSLAEVYYDFIEEWLRREAGKPGSTLPWYRKWRHLEALAWWLFSDERPSRRIGSVDGVAVSDALREAKLLHGDVSSRAYIDDVFHHSLLTPSSFGHTFVHFSFFEAMVASDLCRRFVSGKEELVEGLTGFIPHEIGLFARQRLGALVSLEDQRRAVDNLIKAAAARGEVVPDAREKAAFYAAAVGDGRVERRLRDLLGDEDDLLVRRSLSVGIALHFNDEGLLSRYIEEIDQDEVAKRINVMYFGTFFRDIHPDRDFDRENARFHGTVAAILRHLASQDYESHWPLDLATLRHLAEDIGADTLENAGLSLSKLQSVLDTIPADSAEPVLDQRDRLVAAVGPS